MISRFKVPCSHCGKTNEFETDENVHQLNERLLLFDKKIATVWKALREENEKLGGILKEIAVINKVFEGYNEFIADCEKCDFSKKGSLAQVLKTTFCPSCKGKISLKAVILPPDDPLMFQGKI